MNDRDLVRVLESSVLVRTLEGAGGMIRRAAGSSVLVPAAVRTWGAATRRIGMVLMIAVITHVALIITTQPAAWFSLIVPVAVAGIAVFLIYAHDSDRTDVE